MSTSSWRILGVIAVTSSALIGTAVHPAAAAEEPLFPAGIACTFALDIDGVDNRKVHDFVDVDGNAVQLITGLAGPTTFSNADSGATLTLPARGTAWKVVTSPDESTTSYTTTGHFVLVEVSSRLWMQIVVSAIGIGIMVALAALMQWYRRVEGRRPGPRPPSPGLAGGEA